MLPSAFVVCIKKDNPRSWGTNFILGTNKMCLTLLYFNFYFIFLLFVFSKLKCKIHEENVDDNWQDLHIFRQDSGSYHLVFFFINHHSVLQIWLVEKKFARYATIPIILLDIFLIEIWSQTNILTMAFWENPIFVIFSTEF